MTERPLTLDEILDGASLSEDTVPICLNGKVRREYEAVKARIAERVEEAAAAEAGAALAPKVPGDDRLGARGKAKPAGPELLDPEEPELQRLLDVMKKFTVPFLLRALPSQDWNVLVEKHPARTDPATGKRDPRDWEGIDSSTFYVKLVRESIAEPAMNDAQWAKLRKNLTDAQWDKLCAVAKEINRKDDDVPFSLSELVNPRS